MALCGELAPAAYSRSVQGTGSVVLLNHIEYGVVRMWCDGGRGRKKRMEHIPVSVGEKKGACL
jgi:hypothetical protein